MICDPDDIILVYCPSCDEEYQVVEGESECPICREPVETCND